MERTGWVPALENSNAVDGFKTGEGFAIDDHRQVIRARSDGVVVHITFGIDAIRIR